MKKIIITGGAGFIGSHIAEECVAHGYEVKIIDNLKTGSLDNLYSIKDKITFVRGDIRDLDFLKKEFVGAEFVIHQAALVSVPESIEYPVLSDEINAGGTLNVFEASRVNGIKRVVYASSSAVYGDLVELPIKETSQCKPLSPYALQKKISEDYAKLYAELFGLETVGLRYFNVFGPRQKAESFYSGVIPKFVKALLLGEPFYIYGNGKATRDFVFVKDVALANILACNFSMDKNKNEIINIGSAVGVDINLLTSNLLEIMGKKTLPTYEASRSGDILHSVSDNNKAKKILGFELKTDFLSGLKDAVSWYTGLYNR